MSDDTLLARIRRARARAQPEDDPAGRSTSSSFEVLLTEAKLAAEGRADNYHVPADKQTLGGVQARCKEQDLDPAWVVVDGVE
jgi:hypothetical protein